MARLETGQYTGPVVDEVGDRVFTAVSETGLVVFGLVTFGGDAFQPGAFQDHDLAFQLTPITVEQIAAQPASGDWFVYEETDDYANDTALDVTFILLAVAAEPIETFAAQPDLTANLEWFIEPEQNTDSYEDVAPLLVNDGPIAPAEAFAAQQPFESFDYDLTSDLFWFDHDTSNDVAPLLISPPIAPDEAFAAQPSTDENPPWFVAEEAAPDLESLNDTAPLLINDGPLAADEVHAAQPITDLFALPSPDDDWIDSPADDAWIAVANPPAAPTEPIETFAAQPLFVENLEWSWLGPDEDWTIPTDNDVAPNLINEGPLAADEVHAAQPLLQPFDADAVADLAWFDHDTTPDYTPGLINDGPIAPAEAFTGPIEPFDFDLTSDLFWFEQETSNDVAPSLINEGPLAADEVHASQPVFDPFALPAPDDDWVDSPPDDISWLFALAAPPEPIETFAAQPQTDEQPPWFMADEASPELESLNDVAPNLINDGPIAPDTVFAAQPAPLDFDYETAAAAEFFDQPQDDSWVPSFAIDTETLFGSQLLTDYHAEDFEPEWSEFVPLDEGFLASLFVPALIELFAAQPTFMEHPFEALIPFEMDDYASISPLDPAWYFAQVLVFLHGITHLQGSYVRLLKQSGRNG